MAIALRRAYDATPEPKLVIAAGACACDGGIFGASYATIGAVSRLLPVDVAIPGCPPSPTALLQGILAAISVSAPPAPRTEPVLAGEATRGVDPRTGGEATPGVDPSTGVDPLSRRS